VRRKWSKNFIIIIELKNKIIQKKKLNMKNVDEFELQKRPALDELNATHLNRAHEETSMASIMNTKLFCAHKFCA